MLRDVQPVVPAAVQHEPGHEAVTGLAGATVICCQVVAPLLVVQQRVEGVHVHVVTAGHDIGVCGRQIGDAAVTLGIQGRRGTDDQNLDVCLLYTSRCV